MTVSIDTEPLDRFHRSASSSKTRNPRTYQFSCEVVSGARTAVGPVPQRKKRRLGRLRIPDSLYVYSALYAAPPPPILPTYELSYIITHADDVLRLGATWTRIAITADRNGAMIDVPAGEFPSRNSHIRAAPGRASLFLSNQPPLEASSSAGKKFKSPATTCPTGRDGWRPGLQLWLVHHLIQRVSLGLKASI